VLLSQFCVFEEGGQLHPFIASGRCNHKCPDINCCLIPLGTVLEWPKNQERAKG
jgi:hypothetical protein